MKKKLMGIVMAAALIAAQTVSVFAAPSPTADVTPVGDSEGKYTLEEFVENKLEELRTEAPQVADVIEQINSEIREFEAIRETVAQDIIQEIEEKTQETLENISMLTKFIDLDTIGDVEKTADGFYDVRLQIPTLTESMINVQILHYSTERSVWEVITPDEVDYANKTIRARFQDLSPIVVIAKEDPSKAAGDINSEGTGTAPKTGSESNAAAWGFTAVLLGAGAVAVLRKGTKRA